MSDGAPYYTLTVIIIIIVKQWKNSYLSLLYQMSYLTRFMKNVLILPQL